MTSLQETIKELIEICEGFLNLTDNETIKWYLKGKMDSYGTILKLIKNNAEL